MTRLYGRALRGQRLVEKVPHGHWKTTTLIAALGLMGIHCSTVVDGGIDGDVFLAFCRQVLAPKLEPGDRVVMDNLSSHKVAGVREVIQEAGASLMYLPPYSPDLNPIENAFSKIKQLLRSTGHRLVDELWKDMQPILDQITPSDARGFFEHCGYPLRLG